MVGTQIGRQLVKLYRGWEELEKREHNNSIIDFDLAPRHAFSSFTGRREVLAALQRVAAALLGESTSAAKLEQARVQASLTYLRTLLGEQVEFQTYIEETLCVTPKRFDEDFLAERRGNVEGLLWKRFHLRFDRRQAHRFDSALVITDSKTLPNQFNYFRSLLVPELLKHVPVSLQDYQLHVEFASDHPHCNNWLPG